MTYPLLAPDAHPCVWMCAGLISYRLCDRDFDCEHCPLDAALHPDLPVSAPERAMAPAGDPRPGQRGAPNPPTCDEKLHTRR